MASDQRVSAFAPGSVSNVGCGFEVLGFALEEPGDVVVAERREAPGVEIVELTGDDGRLPHETERNTAGVAVRALLAEVGRDDGIALRLHKRMPLASGLGSSAASGVAAVWAANRLLDLDLPMPTLLRCAMEGERVACGSAHADNAAPSLYGGFVLVRQAEPPDIVPLPVPEALSCAVVRPHVEVETRKARALLGDRVPLRAAVAQWGNLGALVDALHRGDLKLLSRAVTDVIAEPVRTPLVPGFEEIKGAALSAGALACGLSGSGPSIFALCTDRPTAERAANAMTAALEAKGLGYDRIVSRVGAEGARVVEGSELG